MTVGNLLITIISALIALFLLFAIGCGLIMIRCKMLFGDFNPIEHEDMPHVDYDYIRNDPG